MRHSTTIWAVALTVASISGPLLATAEAMPAPQPQKTDAKPRYYFPRHVKRQIFTNSTAPASSTPPAPKTSDLPDTEQPSLRSRQGSGSSSGDDLASFFESLLNSPSASSSSSAVPTTATVTEIHIPLGTGVSSSSSSSVSIYTPPPPIPLHLSDFTDGSADPTTTPDSTDPSASTDIAPTGAFPTSIVIPTSKPSLNLIPDVTSDLIPDITSDVSSISLPTSASSLDLGNPLLKTDASDTPTSIASSDTGAGSTGGFPLSLALPTSVLSDLLPTSFLSDVLPTSVLSDILPTSLLSDILPSSVPDIGSTGLLPSFVITPTISPDPVTTPDASSEPTGIIVGLTTALGLTDLPLVIPTKTDDSISSDGTPTPNPLDLSSILSSVVSGVQSAIDPTDTPSGILPSLGVTGTGTDGTPLTTAPPDPLASIVDPIASVVDSIVSPIISDVSSIAAPIVTPVISDLSSAVAPIVTPVISDVASVVSPIVSDVSSIVDPITPVISDVASIVTPVISDVASVVTPVISDVSSVVTPVISDVASVVTPVVSDVASVVTPVISDVASVVTPVVSDVASVVTPVISDVASVVTPIVTPVISDVASVVTPVVSQVSSIVDPVVSGVSGVVSYLTSDVASVVSSAVSNLPLQSSIPDLPSIISSVIGTGVPPLTSVLASVGTGVGSILPTPTASVDIPLTSDLVSLISSAASDATSYPGTAPTGTAPTAPVSASDGISSLPIPTSVPSGVFPPSATSDGTTIGSSLGGSAPSNAPSDVPITANATTPIIPVPFSTATSEPSFAAPATSDAELPKFTLPPQTILPTGTDSATQFVIPTSIAQEPTTAAQPTAKMTGMPSGMPQIIRPPDGVIPPQPPNTTLCEFGFQWPLNFDFVLKSQDASNQLFFYIPQAVADAVGIPKDQVVMSTLKPYDTTRSLGFITTLALFYMPTDKYPQLLPQMNNPPDLLWNNKNSTINALTSLINTAIPLLAGPLPVDGSPTQSGSPSSTATGGYGDDGPMGKGESQPVNATSAYIATGAIFGAFAYGAAMFFVARRYRNKRMSHQRASSVPSASHRNSASPMGPAWMSGARGPGRSTPGGRDSRGSGSSNGRSVRTAQISAPVMAENSLGWN